MKLFVFVCIIAVALAKRSSVLEGFLEELLSELESEIETCNGKVVNGKCCNGRGVNGKCCEMDDLAVMEIETGYEFKCCENGAKDSPFPLIRVCKPECFQVQTCENNGEDITNHCAVSSDDEVEVAAPCAGPEFIANGNICGIERCKKECSERGGCHGFSVTSPIADVTFSKFGVGNCAQKIERIGNPKTLKEAQVMFLSKPACEGATLQYSGYSYSWGAYCCKPGSKIDSNESWKQYSVSGLPASFEDSLAQELDSDDQLKDENENESLLSDLLDILEMEGAL